MTTKLLIFAVISLSTRISYAEDCIGWFIKSGLAPKSKDCELKCAVTPVDMSTFSCPSSCDNLCSKTIAEQILEYAPRLTEGDKVAISKFPYEAYKVFLAKEKVDTLTEKVFKTPGKNDESDAFRHFIWSALLTQEIGEEKSKIFLNAHEEDSTQIKSEKEMDLENNKVGLEFYLENKKSGKDLDLSDFEKEALTRLRQKK